MNDESRRNAIAAGTLQVESARRVYEAPTLHNRGPAPVSIPGCSADYCNRYTGATCCKSAVAMRLRQRGKSDE